LKGELQSVLPLLHKLVEERAGERRFSTFHPDLDFWQTNLPG
jgi:hypothetical protein